MHVYRADPELGWALRESLDTKVRFANGPEVTHTFDSRGRRSIPEPDAADTRIHFFGDSFMFGAWISDEDAAPYVLWELLGRRVAVLNYAVPGYGIEQMYGRLLRDAEQIRSSDIVVFAPHPDDLSRNLISREGPCGLYFRTPEHHAYHNFPVFGADSLQVRALAKECSLVRDYLLHHSPLPAGRIYNAYVAWRDRNANLANADAIFAAAKRVAVDRGARFEVVFVAGPRECAKGFAEYPISQLRTPHLSMIAYCPKDSAAVPALLHADGYHWSVAGNRWAAESLHAMLRSLGIALPESTARPSRDSP